MKKAWKFFTWRIQLSSSLFTLSPFLVHHLINRGWQSMTVCVLEALRVCGLGVLVPSFDGFSSRRPLLVSHLLVRGICLPSLYALSFPLYGSFSSRAIGFKSVHKMALHVIIPVKGFCYGSTTPRPYPARSLPARLWHRCTDEVFVWAPTQPICDKDFDWAEIRTRVSQLRCRRSNHYSMSSRSLKVLPYVLFLEVLNGLEKVLNCVWDAWTGGTRFEVELWHF